MKQKKANKNTVPKEDRFVQRGLKDIYSNKDGSLPDISHLDVKRGGKWKVYLSSIIFIGLILFGIFFLASSLFRDGSGAGNKSIDLVFESQQSVASGDEVIYILKYENKDKVPLNDVEFILAYPEGFAFISASPEASNEFNTAWQVGRLERGESGQIEIRGKLIGEVGSVKSIKATASYSPENFSSSFKEAINFNSKITSSILQLDVTGPEQILPEKQVSYKIAYKNNSDQVLEDIKITVLYPSNFIFQSAEPESHHNEEDARNLNNQWLLDVLQEDQEGEIEITGGFIVDENNDTAEIKVQIGFIDSDTGEFSLQQEKTISTEVVESNLKLDLIINGSTQGQSVNFGQTLNYSIVYKNNGEKDLDDLALAIELDSDVLNWDSLEDKNDGILDGQSLAWGKDQISEFDLLRPGEEGTIDFSINILPAEEVDLDDVNLSITSKVSGQVVKIGDLEVEELEITGNEIISSVNTDVKFEAQGRYFNDDNIAVGTGPLPPVVGQKTTFRIYWQVSNSLHEIEDVRVTTTLPTGVDWEDKFLVGTGNLSYDSNNKTVTWTINRLPPNISFDEADVWFDVSVTPASSQEGQLIILTDQAVFEGIDAVTGSVVTKSDNVVTSNLQDDPIGGGRGLVIDITE